MKFIEVLELAYIRLGLDKETGFDEVIKTQSRPEIKRLIKCINMAVCEIATNYLFVEKSENALMNEGKIYFKDLSERVLEVRKILQNGLNQPFVSRSDCVEAVCKGNVQLQYRFVPNECGIDDLIELPTKATADMVALGACAEYCLLYGRYDDCVLFDKKFKDALKNAVKQTKNITLKARKW